MPTKKLLCTAMVCSLAAGALLCVTVYAVRGGGGAYVLGSAVGLACSALALWLFFAAWRGAPNGARVALYYVLRILVVFGSVLAAMFLPFIDALGVLLPQLPVIPILALLMALVKPPHSGDKKGGKV